MQLQILEACCMHSVNILEFQSWWIYSWSVQLWIGSSKCYSYTFHANCKCHMWYFNGWYNIFPLEKVLLIASSTDWYWWTQLIHDPFKMNIGNSLATIMASRREGKCYALKSNLIMNFSNIRSINDYKSFISILSHFNNKICQRKHTKSLTVRDLIPFAVEGVIQ